MDDPKNRDQGEGGEDKIEKTSKQVENPNVTIKHNTDLTNDYTFTYNGVKYCLPTSNAPAMSNLRARLLTLLRAKKNHNYTTFVNHFIFLNTVKSFLEASTDHQSMETALTHSLPPPTSV